MEGLDYQPSEAPTTSRVAIFTCLTSSYLKYARALVGSWRRSGNGHIPLHVMAVNIAGGHLRELGRFPNLHVHSVQRRGGKLRDWIVCARFPVFRDLLAAGGYDSMLFLDVDALLMQPLEPVWDDALGNADVSIFERSGESAPHLKVLCGHILVVRNRAGLDFLEAVGRRIEQLGLKFFNDQHGTYLAVLDARSAGINVSQLDSRMVDLDMRDGSWIWAGKGLRGRSRWRYRREAHRCRRYYRQLIRELP